MSNYNEQNVKKTRCKYNKKNIEQTIALRRLDPKRAGIDIGASSVFVCIAHSNGQQEVREYSTFTADLHSMAEWLKEHGVESIAMESTGVYWIPVFEILEPIGFEVILANAHHLKSVPGRKTDVKDSQWIQQLHSCGLLAGSFRPSDEFIRLRAYVRHRRLLTEHAGMQIQLMHKALIQMNVQIHLVLSDLSGKTGLLIVQAILNGQRDPQQLASYRQKGCKNSEETIAKALEGNWREEHILELEHAYKTYEFHHAQVAVVERKIQELLPALTTPIFDTEENKSKDENSTTKENAPVEKVPQRKKRVQKKSEYNSNSR